MTNCKHISTCPFWAKFNDCIDECPCYANADIVEVVRCKDCARGEKYSNRPCYIFCGEHHRLVEREDFCSYGEERIENEQ